MNQFTKDWGLMLIFVVLTAALISLEVIFFN